MDIRIGTWTEPFTAITVVHQRYDGNNGDNIAHIDDVLPVTQLLIKG